jgi:hypothetical protein
MKRIFYKKTISLFCVITLALLSVSFNATGSPKLNCSKKSINRGAIFTLKVKNTSKKVKWSVNNKKVLKIKSKSKSKATFVGLKKGRATVTAKVNGKKLKCRVIVKNKVQNNSKTVYITRTGDKYHNANCSCLRRSKIKKSLSWAKSHGYKPCKLCF